MDELAYDRLDSFCRQAGGPGLVLPTVFLTDAKGRVLTVVRGKDVRDLPEVVRALMDRREPGTR